MSDLTTPETDAAWKEGNAIREWTCRKLERERDEARRKLNNLDVTAIHSCHNECQRPICVLRRERDEAREAATEQFIAGGKAIRERDEAREKLSAAWQSLRDSQDEVLRLTFENRELRNLSNE